MRCGTQTAVELAAAYEARLQEGQKAIVHLEAFVAKFMSAYKSYVVSMMC
jgi:replication factor C subunit 3/5